MNIFHKVTLQSLRKNKTRTVVTIIGIILSAAMICAVTTFVSSLQNYAVEYITYTDGDWHAQVNEVDAQTRAQIETDEKVASAVSGQYIGYAEIENRNEYKPYLCVIGGSDGYFDAMPIHLTSGTLPRNSSEILLPEHLMSYGCTCKLGDVLVLELGDRMLDGWKLGQSDPCFGIGWEGEEEEYIKNDETLEVRETRRYTVVGFYERPNFENYTAAGYTALTVADAVAPSDALFDVYFKMNDAETVYDYMSGLGLVGSYNTDLLLYSGVSRYSTFSQMLVSLAAVVIGLIMFGSIALIYNAFSISVSERTKQFGLLSSVGATKKQLRQMVRFEALAVSAVGIPLGILAGIGGIGVTLLVIGEKFSGMMGGSFHVPLRVCVSWQSVVVAALVALVTVLISAWIPSKRATRVTAVEAIRQNADIKAKPAKTSKLTYKLFGLSGVLASKYYKRSRKKYRATVVSLFMSIVLFVSAAAFTDYLTESVEGGLMGDRFDLYYLNQTENNPDEVLELLRSARGVTGVTHVRTVWFSGECDRDDLTEDFLTNATGLASENGNTVHGYAYFIDDVSFRALLDDLGLDAADYYDPDAPLAVAVDEMVCFNAAKEKYVTVDTLRGDECEIVCTGLRQIEGYEFFETVTDADGTCRYRYRGEDGELLLTEEEAYTEYIYRSGKTVASADAPFYVLGSSAVHLNLIYPDCMMEQFVLHDSGGTFDGTYYLTSRDHAASYDDLKKRLTENGLSTKYLFDYAESEEQEHNLIMIVQVFAYGFIVLISLIAAANVFNTVSTNIHLRRREFAMLKSVGMTQGGLRRMLNYECLLYGTKALLCGLPASAGVTWLIYRAISAGYETRFTLPWRAVGIAAFSVFAVVFATMLYSMRKINRENPIDALKNENL